MNLEKYMNSVFDKFNKLEDPSGHFAWEPIPPSFRFRPGEVICEGDLQEVDSITSFIHSTKHYAATPHAIFQFSVSFRS